MKQIENKITVIKTGNTYQIIITGLDDEVFAKDVLRKIVENVSIGVCSCGQKFVINSSTHKKCKECKTHG